MKIPPLLIDLAVAVALVTGTGLAVAAGPAQVEIEPSDLDPALIAKIAKAKAKSHTLNGDSKFGNGGDVVFDGGSAGRSRCGNVDIGNVTTTGPAWQAPREITVVVTGDVVNAGNNCKN